jgi:hypothetical protein
MEQQPEVWKKIEGCESIYLVSSFGRVKTFDGKRVPVSQSGFAVSGKPDKRMRLRINFVTTNKKKALTKTNCKTVTLKRIVFDTFVAKLKEKIMIRHLDGNEKNCRLDNLFVTFGCEILFNGSTDAERILKELVTEAPIKN